MIAIGQVCDNNCDVILNKRRLVTIIVEKIILQGARNLNNGLWDIPVQKRRIEPHNYKLSAIHPAIYSQKITFVYKIKIVYRNIKTS